MISRKIHNYLINNELTRKHQYRLLGSLRKLLGCPDAYADIWRHIAIVKPDGVLDIGCYKGETIARFLEETRLPIDCFEPTPTSYEFCVKRFSSSKRVRVYNLALSDKSGIMKLNENKNPQTNSILEANPDAEFGDRLDLEKTTKVNVTTLDDWAIENKREGKYFVKADIQGAEEKFIRGGHKFIANNVTGIYSEVQLSSVYQGQGDFFSVNRILTKGLGFKLLNIYPAMKDHKGYAAQCDAFWVRLK